MTQRWSSEFLATKAVLDSIMAEAYGCRNFRQTFPVKTVKVAGDAGSNKRVNERSKFEDFTWRELPEFEGSLRKFHLPCRQRFAAIFDGLYDQVGIILPGPAPAACRAIAPGCPSLRHRHVALVQFVAQFHQIVVRGPALAVGADNPHDCFAAGDIRLGAAFSFKWRGQGWWRRGIRRLCGSAPRFQIGALPVLAGFGSSWVIAGSGSSGGAMVVGLVAACSKAVSWAAIKVSTSAAGRAWLWASSLSSYRRMFFSGV